MITKFGKRFVTNYLAGHVAFPAQDLALGIANGTDYALADTNSRLGYEFYRIPVAFSSIDIQTDGNGDSTYAIVYKAIIPQDIAGLVKEIGLYPGIKTSLNNYDSRLLADFENNLLWSDSLEQTPAQYVAITPYVNDATTPVPRVGNSLAEIEVVSSGSNEYKTSIPPTDLSGYSSQDSLVLAFNQADTNLQSIVVKFYSSDTDYYSATFTGAVSSGNKILSINFSALVASSSAANLSSITKIGVEVNAKSSGDTVVRLDGLRVNDEDTFDPTYGLISRSVLTTPLTKVAGRPVDIEYRLGLTF